MRHGFVELAMLSGRQLWKERNTRTFRGYCASPGTVVLFEEGKLWVIAGFRQLILLALSLTIQGDVDLSRLVVFSSGN